MKKAILLLAFIVTLASCSAPATEEVAAPAADSTCVDADTTCVAACDSVKADTAKVK